MTPKPRAEPLSKGERRLAIVDAVIPLLVEKGPAVTTAEMAEAAGVAEGTIFRVFPDKAALLRAAVEASFDPEADLARVAAISDDVDLEERVRRAAVILEERFDRLHTLMPLIRSLSSTQREKRSDGKRAAREANQRMIIGLAGLLEGCSSELSVPPERAATVLNNLMFAIHLPFTAPEDRLSADEAVSVLLDGIKTR